MPKSEWDWQSPKGKKEIAGLARKLAKDDSAFTLLLLSRKLDIDPSRRTWFLEGGRKATVLDVKPRDRQKLYELMENAPSKTHESLARELFDMKKSYGLRHIKSFFGQALGDKLIADFIEDNFSLSPHDAAAELGMKRVDLAMYARRAKGSIWKKWREKHLAPRKKSFKHSKQENDAYRVHAKGARKKATLRAYRKK